MFSPEDLAEILEFVSQKVQQELAAARANVIGYEATVARASEIGGTSAISTITSPNGGTVQQCYVFINVADADKSISTATKCNVDRHVTGLTEGDRVHIAHDSPQSTAWNVTARR